MRSTSAAMVREMARVTRHGGWVCALNEGTRALGAPRRRPRPGRGEGLRHQRARPHALRVPVGVHPRRARRATGGAGGGLQGTALAEDRRAAAAVAGRRAQRRDVVLPDLPRLLRASRSMPARAGPRLVACRSTPISIRYRELFGSLFRRDLQARYKGTIFGVAWSLANPLLLMAIYLLVFSRALEGHDDRPLSAVPALRALRSGSSSRRR